MDDRTVTIRKPLGLILDADSKGDVFVKEVVKGEPPASSHTYIRGVLKASPRFAREKEMTNPVCRRQRRLGKRR